VFLSPGRWQTADIRVSGVREIIVRICSCMYKPFLIEQGFTAFITVAISFVQETIITRAVLEGESSDLHQYIMCKGNIKLSLCSFKHRAMKTCGEVEV
jgi:hypothetical protein